MTEWLNENANRAYPLEHEWPDDLAALGTPVLRDACIGYDGLPEDGRITLLRVGRASTAVSVRIGVSADSFLDILLVPGDGSYSRAYARGPHYKVLLTVSNTALSRVLASVPDGWHAQVNVPFALRCCSYANRRVTAVEACAPEDPCAHPLYVRGQPHVVKSVTGDVVLVSKDGIDADVTQMSPLPGGLLRLSAVTAPLETRVSAKPVDMMIRGDACVQVDAIPGVAATEGGALVPLSNPEKGGVVRLTEKCKPCCQCEDYENAFEALKPGDKAITDIADDLDDLLNNAESGYKAAVALLDEIKDKAIARINDYTHVVASAVAVASGGITPDVTSAGTRCRLAANLTVVNMTLKPVKVSEVAFAINGYSPVKVHWGTAGSVVRSGTSLTDARWPVTLQPGDTLSVVETLSKLGTTNTATKPSVMTAVFTAQIHGQEPKTIPVDIK